MAGVDFDSYSVDPQQPSVYPKRPWNDFPLQQGPLQTEPTEQTPSGGYFPNGYGSAGFSQLHSPAGASPMAPSAGGAPPTGGPEYRTWLAQQYHTPDNIAKDYWAPDWKEVFASPSRWGASAPAAPAAQGAPFDINAFGQGWMGSGGRTLQDWQNYVQSHPLGSGYSLSGSKGDKVVGPNGQGWDAVIASGMGGTGASWNPFGSGGAGGGGGTAGSVFSDPATAQWEQLLRTLTERLQQPQPTYTPSQMDTLQTQALDPLTRERDAAKQRLIEQYAAHGHQPGHSGIVDQALQNLDRQFEQMRTQQQSGFAVNQINREDQLFNSNEQRALAGLNLFHQIPQLADQRLATANAMLMPMNPASLIGLQNQQYGQNQQNAQWNQMQDQQFWQWLGQLFAGLGR